MMRMKSYRLRENICKSRISQKTSIVSRVYKDPQKSTVKKHTAREKWARDMNRRVAEEPIYTADKHVRNVLCLASSADRKRKWNPQRDITMHLLEGQNEREWPQPGKVRRQRDCVTHTLQMGKDNGQLLRKVPDLGSMYWALTLSTASYRPDEIKTE